MDQINHGKGIRGNINFWTSKTEKNEQNPNPIPVTNIEASWDFLKTIVKEKYSEKHTSKQDSYPGHNLGVDFKNTILGILDRVERKIGKNSDSNYALLSLKVGRFFIMDGINFQRNGKLKNIFLKLIYVL